MSMFKKAFGSRLKYIRKLHNYTQEKLAELIGINLRQLARIEAGESFITAETLEKICFIFNITPSVLFDFEIFNETKMVANGEKVHFNVIKNGNVIHLINAKEDIKQETPYKPKYSLLKNIDDKMIKLAQDINKDITLDEYENGIVNTTKVFHPNGKYDIIPKNDNKNLLLLKENIDKIILDNRKIDFINLAFNALSNTLARQQLRMLIDGMDLVQ